MKEKRKTRIKDIAEKAGVSIGTVDRVLHNRGEVKEETKAKVLDIAKQMNYQPNMAARALKSPVSYKIAAILPKSTGNNLYWKKHPLGIAAGQESSLPFIIHVEYFNFEIHSANDFLENAKKLIDWEPNAVIIAPILKNETISLCNDLDNKSIPYAFIDTHIEEANALTFIGENAYKGGRVAASIMDLGVSTDKDILIVNIGKDLENILHLNLRTQGFMSYFLDSGKNTGLKISVEVPGGDKKGIYDILDRVFQNNQNIEGVMITSSRTFVIAEYLKNRNLNNLFVVGYEAHEMNAQFLKDGVINYLISQRPVEQGEKTLKRLFEFISHHIIPEKREYQPIDIINVENME